MNTPYFQRLTKISVKELKEALRKYTDDTMVYLSVDEEQNAIADDIAIECHKDGIVFLPLNPIQN